MMRSDSDLDEVESFHGPPTPTNDEIRKKEPEEIEPTKDTNNNKHSNTKKEWRKLWRSQKTYWRERENEANKRCDERDEVEQNEGSSSDHMKQQPESKPNKQEHKQGNTTNTPTESESSEVVGDLDTKETAKEKHGWTLLKRLQQRRAAQAMESDSNDEEGENQPKNDKEESALWKDILFTIGSLTDDENGISTDEDLDRSLDDIEEQIFRQAGIETNSENASGVIPPSPWSSLKRLRDKIKENSSNAKDEELDFSERDKEKATRGKEVQDDGEPVVDESRDEVVEEKPRAWSSLKRLRGRIRETSSTDKADKGEQNVEVANGDDTTNEENGGVIGEEALEAPSPWSTLKRFRDKIKENTNTGEEPDKPADAKDKNGEELESEADDGDIIIENNGEKNELTCDEANSKRWGVLDRLRKKLEADSNKSIEDQIASLAKELEKEQQRSAMSKTAQVSDDTHAAEEETEENQETNKSGQRKGWTLFKMVQDRLTLERTEEDDDTYGYENIDEAFAFRTIHVLHTRNQELEDLVERLQRANEILKAECKLNNVKVTELTNIIEAKDGNVAEDVLLQKSIENAELLMQVDELQVELDKANSSVQRLKAENKEQKRLINGMGRALDALHSAHMDESSVASVGASSIGPSGELSIDNLEPKIQRIMKDREQLVLRCNKLERENELKDEQIEKLSEALDAQSFQFGGSVEKVKEDDQSVHSEMTRSTYTGTSVSSSSIESDDNVNSRLRILYNSVSSKMMPGNMESVQEDDDMYYDTENNLYAVDDDESSVNAVQGQNDELESMKKRLNKSDPKYVEFLSLMGQKGMVLRSVPSGEGEERPNERPEQETTNRDEIICELVV